VTVPISLLAFPANFVHGQVSLRSRLIRIMRERWRARGMQPEHDVKLDQRLDKDFETGRSSRLTVGAMVTNAPTNPS
jgi:hypothetical protein